MNRGSNGFERKVALRGKHEKNCSGISPRFGYLVRVFAEVLGSCEGKITMYWTQHYSKNLPHESIPPEAA